MSIYLYRHIYIYKYLIALMVYRVTALRIIKWDLN